MQSDFASRQFARAVLLVVVLAGWLFVPLAARGSDWATPVTGNLLGTVVDTAGIPQVGASVKLFNKYDRMVAKTVSTADGRFAFGGLSPDSYSIHVSLESFVPAFRDKIAIRAGGNSMLQINLATLFSSIQLNPVLPAGAMSSDWKWVLRSSPATRPITRFLPDEDTPNDEDSYSAANLHPQLFSGTHMLVGISGGGDTGLVGSDPESMDIGTQFALSTNLYGKSGLQVAGRLGQKPDAGPNTFSIGAIYTPSSGFGFGFADPPEIAFTMSQIHVLPGGQGAGGNDDTMLRSMSLSMYESADPTDEIHLEYGISAESVDFLQHAGRISPFARVTADLGKGTVLVLAFSDGGRADELTAHTVSKNSEPEELLDDDLSAPMSALARIPEMSLRNSRLELQSTRNMEVGVSKTRGNTTFSFSTFHERVLNGRMDVAGDLSVLDAGSILSDGVSKTSIYNIGNYSRDGYVASIDRKLSDAISLQAAYGRLGAFTAAESLMPGVNTKEDFLASKNHNTADFGLRARIPKCGTRISARYGWADPRASIPDHTFTTQNLTLATGLNIVVRQPLPSFFGMGGRLELVGDLRNMLSQGYLPVLGSGGERLLIVQTPKAIRGGLSITF